MANKILVSLSEKSLKYFLYTDLTDCTDKRGIFKGFSVNPRPFRVPLSWFLEQPRGLSRKSIGYSLDFPPSSCCVSGYINCGWE